MTPTTYTGSLHDGAAANYFDSELLAEFVVSILREPHNRTQHATRLYGGNWERASALLRYSETAEFSTILMNARKSTAKVDQTFDKETFLIAVQDKMSGFEGELWLKTAQFYAKLRGFITDAPTVAIQNNVIQVPTKADANAWEANAKQHQYALQSEAREIHD